MQLLKKFIDGFLAKLGEFTAAAVVASLAGLAWLSFPAHFTVSRWILIALIVGEQRSSTQRTTGECGGVSGASEFRCDLRPSTAYRRAF